MIPRLYIDAPANTPLTPETVAPLDQAQAHYLKNVLRRNEGDPIRVFNGRDGEFDAVIVALKKKGGLVTLGAQSRASKAGPDLQLCFAPVKRGPLEMIAQKATEMGVARLTPVITARTTAPKLNCDRLRAIAVEAAEQCGRINVPSVDEPVKFADFISGWDPQRPLIFCDEAGDDEGAEWGGASGRAAPMLEVLSSVDRIADKTAILTGPEGGFTKEERDILRARSFVQPVTLGPRILRADTAVIAALSLWQAARGDWR